MLSIRRIICLLLLGTVCSGCAVIAGKEAAMQSGEAGKNISLAYVETLRNEASLRGEAFRDVVFSASTPTSLQRPNSIFADQFRVYVTDQTQPPRVFIFDRGSQTVKVLAAPVPPAEGKLLNPTGIAVDAGNIIYVADPQQGRVFGYDRNGTLLLTFGKNGDLAYPQHVSVDRWMSRIYIADAHAHLVKAFSQQGDRIFEMGGDGPADRRISSPVALALDRRGIVHVLDGKAREVVIFDSDGRLVRRFTLKQGTPGDSIRPRGIAVDSSGHIYVSDSVNNNILIFGPDGKFLTTFGKTGIVSGDFWTPQGLFIDERDQLYIADQTNGRVQVYQLHK